MSIHIEAEKGEIAQSVLLPGDPLRAKFFAETLLEDAVCFNEVRNMLGYTGAYKGKRVSVMGSGMGIPSFLIYAHELINDYGAKTLIRVGTCGALQPNLKVGDLVLAMAASSDSHINRLRFGGKDYAPSADFGLLRKAVQEAEKKNIPVQVGGILSSDTFYNDDEDWWKQWADFGLLVVEMETSGLYTIAAESGVKALSILTVSDSLVTGEAATAEQRETAYPRMAEIALEICD